MNVKVNKIEKGNYWRSGILAFKGFGPKRHAADNFAVCSLNHKTRIKLVPTHKIKEPKAQLPDPYTPLYIFF